MKAQHTIQLSRPATQEVGVSWQTRDNTAKAGIDYAAASGRLTFAPGQTKGTIEVEILERTGITALRQFEIVLSDASSGTIVDDVGRCYILPNGVAIKPSDPVDDGPYVPDGTEGDVGPLILHGLITNSYHNVLGRGGYFHERSGTSEGQAVAIEGALLAGRALRDSDPEAAAWYRQLGLAMLDAMGDGSRRGPMLRQPIPESADTITLPHWLFAARGKIPSQAVRYDYPATVQNGKLVITEHAKDVFRVFAIYPATSNLLYENPYSQAYDATNPAGETQIPISSWSLVGDRIEIPVSVTGDWKIIFGYGNVGTIEQGEAQEAYPFWTKIPDGYSACAPDTFRWFDLALDLAAVDDPRGPTAWLKLRDAMRKTAVRGQAISDLREVFEPMPGFPALPKSGEPSGLFCYASHPAATPPPAGYNQSWTGYNFWSREADGTLLGRVPSSNRPCQVQIGRGFNDAWRQATPYQDADQFLWVQVAFAGAVDATRTGKAYAYVSSTKTYDASTRWYADLTAMAGWAQFVQAFGSSAGVLDLFIPRALFFRKDLDNAGLPAGTRLENFGISVEFTAAYSVRLRNMRMVSDASASGKKGAKMPYFPGAMPFAINADTINQQFVGWNGSPFHGYQLPDFWLFLEKEAAAVHPGLTPADLPTADIGTGALRYPIQARSGAGTVKPQAALLMEQQLLFLRDAQQKWAVDAGFSGPFAHTFVLNTPARLSIGNPTPHTWVYVNDDPNTRWCGYQVRVVESLTKSAWLARRRPGFEDCRDLAASMALAWLNWLNGAWPNLDGVVVDGKRIYGPPTDLDNPRLKPVQALYEEPHIAAVALRACVWLKLYSPSATPLCDALIKRCWDYLERLWVVDGPMKGTWCPNPSTKEWFGFWHFEIITSICTMLSEQVIPAGATEALLRERLISTYTWLRQTGVK